MSTERHLLIASFTEQVSNGQKLYAENCASCHGDSGVGGTKAPPVANGVDLPSPLTPEIAPPLKIPR
jgi:mono/diheme cytochrome c family protein